MQQPRDGGSCPIRELNSPNRVPPSTLSDGDYHRRQWFEVENTGKRTTD